MVYGRRKPKPQLLAIAIAIAFVVFSVLTTQVVAEFSLENWRWYKDIELHEGVSDDGLASLSPDLQVFAWASPGLDDLRIVETTTGKVVPYKILIERGEERRSTIPVTMRDLRIVDGDFTSFVVDVGHRAVLHNEVEIQTASENFQRNVVIESSDDGETWSVLRTDEQIFDVTVADQDIKERLTRGNYPDSSSQFVRLRVEDGDEAPLKISGAAAFFSQLLPAKEVGLNASISDVVEDEPNRSTVLTLDFGSGGFPAYRLLLEVPQQNFYRTVRIESSADGETWSFLGTSSIFDYHTTKIEVSSKSLEFPEALNRYYRLTILDEDNSALAIDSVRLFGFARKVVFPATEGSSYRLYYGNSEASSASYDFERVYRYMVTEGLPRTGLGVQVPNGRFALIEQSFTERFPWLLPTAVGIASLVVGLFLANLFRQIRTLLPPPNDRENE